MKLLDRVLRYNGTQEFFRNLRDLLAQPDRNHSGEAPAAQVDRFIIDCAPEIFANVSVDLSGVTLLDGFKMVRLPLETGWLEWEEQNAHFGCLWIGRQVDLFWGEVGKPQDLRFVGSIGNELKDCFTCEGFPPSEFVKIAARVIGLLFCLSSPRAATVERRVAHQASAPALRKFQRGRPVYSYNVVKLKLPEPTRQGGTVSSTEGAAKRGHWVRGHWRLILNVNEPYWTWVEGHKAGDESLGFVTKERHVELTEAAVRKGFAVPMFEGNAGMRIPAARAALH